jgi:hypothetical protein
MKKLEFLRKMDKTTKKLISTIESYLDKIEWFDKKKWYEPGTIKDPLLAAILDKPNKESNSNKVEPYKAGDIIRFFDNVYKHANESEYDVLHTKVIYLYYYCRIYY